jgi:hypothetical protein
MVAQFGMAAGVAIAALGLQWRTAEHMTTLAEKFYAGSSIYQQQLQHLTETILSFGGGPQSMVLAASQLAQQLSQQASLLACLEYFSAVAVVGVVGAVIMAMQKLTH